MSDQLSPEERVFILSKRLENLQGNAPGHANSILYGMIVTTEAALYDLKVKVQ